MSQNDQSENGQPGARRSFFYTLITTTGLNARTMIQSWLQAYVNRGGGGEAIIIWNSAILLAALCISYHIGSQTVQSDCHF